MITSSTSRSTTPVQSDCDSTSDDSTALSTVVGSSSQSSLPSDDEVIKPREEHVSNDDLAIYPYQEASQPRTLVDILRETIDIHPEALAIDNGSSRLTYADLLKQIEAKAAQLREAGVVLGDRVGIRLSSGTLDLYVSILAVICTGAAYVPVDVDDPEERAALVWSEAGVCIVLTDDGILSMRQTQGVGSQDCPSINDDAWIIFTSGSTGKPKGVAVSHRSAAAFVDAEKRLFLPLKPLGPGDRVLAGLSVAFDASCEEMWLAWANGACLVPASRSLVKAGSELGAFLTEQRISVVSTVPTLAAMWPAEALSNIRLLILGGEACSPELSDRLSNSVAEVWNTYGPTEATVVSCAARLIPKQPVAIGLPLAGWRLAVVAPNGRPVRWGEEGELIIGGMGMARYLDAEKDKSKFSPFADFSWERAYRSGDLVRAEREGLFFVGRNDEQIKFGGRRIELGEIEAALMSLEGVSAAACTIQRSEMGSQVLVGYVVRKCAVALQDREVLRSMLPPSLVPMVVTVDHIPVRTSGKVDRKALPWPLPASLLGEAETFEGTMAIISEQWRRVLGVSPSQDSNFFDLGGTSLGAAQLVSQLRGRVPSLAVTDVYENASLSDLAARFDELSGVKQQQRQVRPTPRLTFVAQLPILLLEFLLEGLRLLAIMILTKKAYAARLSATSWAAQHDLPWWLVAVIWFLLISMPGRVIVFTTMIRLLMIKMAPGTYPRGGPTHIRLWAAERLAGIGRLGPIAGTVWCRMYARMLGCRVGAQVQLHALPPITGLGTFGTGCAVEPEADVAGWWLDGDLLHIGRINVETGARVGTRSMLMPDTTVEAFATVQPGVCAKGIVQNLDSMGSASTPDIANAPSIIRRAWTAFRDTTTLLLLDILPVLVVAPAWGLAAALTPDYEDLGAFFLALLEMMLPGSVLGLFIYAGIIVILVRLASTAIVPGTHSWHSRAAWAAWLTRTLMLEARTTLFPIYASLLTPVWLRILGAHIGRNVEISTVVPIPCLLRVEEGAFLADDVLVSPYRLGVGNIELGVTSIGERTFIGNTGLVDSGIEVPEKVLVGVHATAPSQDLLFPGSTWLGRPAISLPRQAEELASSKRTFDPDTRLVVARALVEMFRLIPLLILGVLSFLVFLALLWFLAEFGVGYAILVSPGFFLAAVMTACSITTAAKWLLTPCVRAGQQTPLWSHFVWRNELADTFVQSLALPYLQPCFGTPLLSLWMRSLGAKIGHGVWLESHLLPEAELCTIGDGATVNRQCVLQTHLFHDRVLRLDNVCLQAGATLGPNSIALPGTDIGAGVTIGPKSLVMRGEQIPAGTAWLGNPVRPWARDSLDVDDRSRTSSRSEETKLEV